MTVTRLLGSGLPLWLALESVLVFLVVLSRKNIQAANTFLWGWLLGMLMVAATTGVCRALLSL